jgi:hypothetical protein
VVDIPANGLENPALITIQGIDFLPGGLETVIESHFI